MEKDQETEIDLTKVKKFCFFGHVDAGKSTCAGHLFALCGGIEGHELDKIKNECTITKSMTQLWSRVLDTNEEERVKGKTHEFNMLPFVYNKQSFQLIDTPGHKMFIREMINGISLFESSGVIGCLVISSAKGEFEAGWIRGQTKEDIIIARSIGIKHLIVLINKLDVSNWDKKIFDSIIKEVGPFVTDACGFKNAYYIPVSGYQGIGLVGPENAPTWYTGLSLIDTIASIDTEQKDVPKPLELTEFNSFLCEIKILHCENLISTGFECIIHFCGDEYEVMIEKISGKKFLKKKDKAKCIIKSKKMMTAKYPSTRIIIRDSTNTIGFGSIMKVKKESFN
jgi:elongation factor 1 alpha-like protein